MGPLLGIVLTLLFIAMAIFLAYHNTVTKDLEKSVHKSTTSLFEYTDSLKKLEEINRILEKSKEVQKCDYELRLEFLKSALKRSEEIRDSLQTDCKSLELSLKRSEEIRSLLETDCAKQVHECELRIEELNNVCKSYCEKNDSLEQIRESLLSRLTESEKKCESAFTEICTFENELLNCKKQISELSNQRDAANKKLEMIKEVVEKQID